MTQILIPSTLSSPHPRFATYFPLLLGTNQGVRYRNFYFTQITRTGIQKHRAGPAICLRTQGGFTSQHRKQLKIDFQTSLLIIPLGTLGFLTIQLFLRTPVFPLKHSLHVNSLSELLWNCLLALHILNPHPLFHPYGSWAGGEGATEFLHDPR